MTGARPVLGLVRSDDVATTAHNFLNFFSRRCVEPRPSSRQIRNLVSIVSFIAAVSRPSVGALPIYMTFRSCKGKPICPRPDVLQQSHLYCTYTSTLTIPVVLEISHYAHLLLLLQLLCLEIQVLSLWSVF